MMQRLSAQAGPLTLTFPLSWADLTLGQLTKLSQAQTGYDELRALCSDPSALDRLPDPLAGEQLRARLQFLDTPPPAFSQWPLPDVLTVGGKVLPLPGNIALESFGQKLAADDLLRQPGEFDRVRGILAIYLYPAYSGELFRYQLTDLSALSAALDEVPAREALPLAAFFLDSWKRLASSGRITYRVVTRRPTLSWKWLRAWFPRWRRTKPTASSTQ